MKIKKLFSIVAAATVLVGAASLLASCKNAADNKTNNDSSKGQMQSDSPVRAEQAEQEFKAAIKALDEAKTEVLKNDDVKKELNKLPAVGQAVAPKEYGDYTKAEADKTAADKTLGEKEKAHETNLAALLAAANKTKFEGVTDNGTTDLNADGKAVLKAIKTNKADLEAYVNGLPDTAANPSKAEAQATLEAALTAAELATPKSTAGNELDGLKTAAEAAYGDAFDGTGGTKKGVTDAEAAVKTKSEELAKAEAALSEAVGKADAAAVEKAQKAVIINYVVQVEKEASEAKGALDTAMTKTPGAGTTAAEIAAEQAATKAAYVQAQEKASKVKNVKAALDKVVVKAEQVTRAAETDKTEKIQKAVLKICEIIAKSGVEDSTLKSKIDEAKNIIK